MRTILPVFAVLSQRLDVPSVRPLPQGVPARVALRGRPLHARLPRGRLPFNNVGLRPPPPRAAAAVSQQ